jgi:hypothetical protein
LRGEGRGAAPDQPLVHHGGALALQLIFVGGGVMVGPDRNRRRPW